MKIKILNCVINCFIILSWWVAGFASESSIQIVATESLTYPVGSAAFTDAEYFIDTDPGVGQATTITYTISDNRATINKSITLGALAEGLHVLYVRFKDSETGWGPARGTSFIVVSGSTVSYQISRAEYYIDTDPGKGQATALTISSADANVVVTGDYNTSSLANGEHTLYVRFYNDKSGWGPARGTKFYIATAATDYAIAGAEYFFDTDPGKGNGTAISVPSDGAFDESIEEFSITPNLPAIGQHQLFLRLRDNFGRWGPPRAVNFEVKESQVTDLIISGAEYYIDTDPGKGAGTAIPAPVDGTYDEAVEDVTANFNVAGLPEGRHIVYVRTKDSRGHWGPARGTPFIVSTEAQPVITAAEYFFNADPGEGNGIQLPAEDGAYNTTDEEGKIVLPVASTGLAVGNHRVYVRFKNSRGTWGPKKSADFSIVVKPVIELSLTSIAFGTVFIGDSAKENFVIRNRGDANLTISTITAPTGYTTNFKTVQGTIVPGDSLIVTVTFRPTAETNYNGNLVIANNDVQKSIALTGRGSTVPVSKITMTPTAPLNFGNVDIFTDVSKSLQVKITNTGTKKLWISKIVSSDTLTFNHDFPALTDSIAINGFVTFHVIFTPKDTISYTGYLTINNNSPTASYQYDLVGQGVGTFAPHIATLSDVINFGTVQVGSSSAKKLLIANTGTINLSLSSIISSNPDITTNLSASNNTVTPKDTNEIIVTFQPTSAANYNASLQINSNDTPNSPKIVSVSGIGSATPVPDIQVSASTLNFGNIKLDAPAVSRTVTIYNKGTANLNISSIATDDAVFTDNISGSQILPSNGNLTVQVTFKPTASKVYDANLIIQNNDPDDATLFVALHGSSIFPEIFLLTSNLNFGNVPVTTASDLTITVENEGTDTLKISGFQKSSELTGVISITPTSYNILPSASKNFKATFTPVNPILYTGEIIILNNDQPETVHVSGQGIDNIPPTITFDPSVLAANPVAINTPIAISASAQDNNKIDWVRLYYRKAGIAKFDSVTLTQSGSNFSGTIPSARVSERGVEYYLKAFDGANYRTIPTTAPTVPAIVRVRVPALPPKTMLAEKYEMFSIPSDLNLKNVKSILETSLGTYDINVWRLFRWINGAYVELKDDESFAFDPGKAYWLITAEQKVLTFDTSLSVRTDQDYEMSLYQGWNQVGTPFYFPIDWTDVFTASGSDVVQQGQRRRQSH